ncbi:E3.1.11.2 [Mytilus coruscus]|uniref:E3.1.11.2 n=1 Tax=Mytilus coruscus TaxID=42192 RepID=A0A6J8B9J2_MYTCO|nr:E3.1.11.2 [Mytilus coruscus]
MIKQYNVMNVIYGSTIDVHLLTIQHTLNYRTQLINGSAKTALHHAEFAQAIYITVTQQSNATYVKQTSSGIETNNTFDTLTNNKETLSSSKCTSDKSRNIFTSKIRMVSININGLRGKKLELQTYLQTENPEIVALQETKIDKSITTNELIPDTLGYDIYRNDRTGNGGGTMLLIKTHLDSAPLKILENGSESI